MNNLINDHFKKLVDRADNGSLPHALLIAGEQGFSQLEQSKLLSQVLLCQNRAAGEYHACLQCRSCHLLQSSVHPDYYEIKPEVTAERESKEIKVDQIRVLSSRLALTSQYQGLKIAIIYPADRLNRNAANSLLKTLEEPSQDSLLLLITSMASRLPATIRSRCQKLIFAMPSAQAFQAQLSARFPEQDVGKLMSASNGSMENAQKIVDAGWLECRDTSFRLLNELLTEKADVSDVAKKLISLDALEPFFNWMVSWLEDMTKLKMNVSSAYLQNQDYQIELARLSEQAELNKVVGFYADIIKARQLLLSSANMQLLIESVLLSWAVMFSRNVQGRRAGRSF